MVFKKKQRNFKKRKPVRKRIVRTLKSRGVVRILKTGMYILPIILLMFGAWHLYHELLKSPYLAIKEIKIAGNRKVSMAEVLELAGVNVGDNLLKVDVAEIKKSVKLNPWISEVSVARNFPDRINIEIKERKPIAFINLDGLYFVDETGIIFKKISLEDELDLPVITGLKREDIEEGAKTSELAIQAVNLLHILAKKGIFANEELSEINVDKTYGLTLYTMQQGTRIELGEGEFTDKIARLERVINSRNGLAGVELIGLNYNKGVVVKLTSGELKQEAGKSREEGKRTKIKV